MAMQRVQVAAIVGVAMTGIIVSVLAASLLMAYQSIPNGGSVKAVNVGVYWDSACTNNVSSVNWDFLSPGESKSVTVYVKNTGNQPVMLNMTTDNWNPASAQTYITLVWNREGYILDTIAPVVQATLTISASLSTTGFTGFSFDAIITGTGQT
jgi:hypothetical protein